MRGEAVYLMMMKLSLVTSEHVRHLTGAWSIYRDFSKHLKHSVLFIYLFQCFFLHKKRKYCWYELQHSLWTKYLIHVAFRQPIDDGFSKRAVPQAPGRHSVIVSQCTCFGCLCAFENLSAPTHDISRVSFPVFWWDAASIHKCTAVSFEPTLGVYARLYYLDVPATALSYRGTSFTSSSECVNLGLKHEVVFIYPSTVHFFKTISWPWCVVSHESTLVISHHHQSTVKAYTDLQWQEVFTWLWGDHLDWLR